MGKREALEYLVTCSHECWLLLWDLNKRFGVPQRAELYNMPLRIEEARMHWRMAFSILSS